MALFEQTLYSCILGGLVDALIALGFALALGVLNIPNFSHGVVVLVGVYLAYVAGSSFGLTPLVALVPIMVALALAGAAYYFVVVRPLLSRPHTTHVVTTLGTMVAAQALLTYLFTSTSREVPGVSLSSIRILSGYVPVAQIIGAAVAFAAMIIVGLAMNRTTIGLGVRACVSSLEAAKLSGIRVNRLFAIAFITTVVVAVIAGVALSLYTPAQPTDDVTYLTTAFAVFVLAGSTRITALIVSGMVISAITAFGATYLSASYSEALLFAAVAATLLFKPEGLFSGH